MESQVATGRRIVLAVIVATLTTSVLVIVAFNISLGPDRLPQQIIRFLLTVGLCVFLYRGANWARWVAVILFILGSVGSLLGGVALLSSNITGLLMMALGLSYLVSAVVLLFVPIVRAYFSLERADTDALRLEPKFDTSERKKH